MAGFSGKYKEHLALAITSDRCFQVATEIMDLYRRGMLYKQKKRKVNRCLLFEMSSFKDEGILYLKLQMFRDGKLSKEDFNTQLKELKKSSRAECECQLLRNEVEKKDREIAELKQKIRELESHHFEQNKNTDKVLDVYDYASDDSNDSSGSHVLFTARPQATYGSREESSEELEEELLTQSSDLDNVENMAPSPNITESIMYTDGETVEALEEGHWYKARVLSSQEQMYHVHWLGYSRAWDQWLPSERIRQIASKFQVGDKVEARWRVRIPTLYPGSVVEIHGEKLNIKFDDGMSKEVPSRYVKARK